MKTFCRAEIMHLWSIFCFLSLPSFIQASQYRRLQLASLGFMPVLLSLLPTLKPDTFNFFKPWLPTKQNGSHNKAIIDCIVVNPKWDTLRKLYPEILTFPLPHTMLLNLLLLARTKVTDNPFHTGMKGLRSGHLQLMSCYVRCFPISASTLIPSVPAVGHSLGNLDVKLSSQGGCIMLFFL